MSDANLIIDKIRHELNRGLPSKRKILSYLVDFLNKNKYPSLSNTEFYDMVGETYKLNLEYKLNLKMLFDPIYNALKKKIKKLYGDEKRLEMVPSSGTKEKMHSFFFYTQHTCHQLYIVGSEVLCQTFFQGNFHENQTLNLPFQPNFK